MGYIATTFAHGNGPFSRVVDLVIAYNNIRERNGLERLSSIFPLVPSYAFKDKEPGSRQIQFMKEIVEEAGGKDFFKQHPYEFLLDIKQGELLDRVLFKGSNYEEALIDFIKHFEKNKADFLKLFEDGKREVKTLNEEFAYIDLRDVEISIDFNNRIETGFGNSYYINGGAGYFDEILERALSMENVKLNKNLIKKAIPYAEKLTKYQKLHFISDPGVFSYDAERKKAKETEVYTPPQIHMPRIDETFLSQEGIYVIVTGISGIAKSGIYNVASKMGLQIYSNDDEFNKKFNGIKHPPFKIANPKIKAQIARTGWSSVWQIHMLAEHGLNMGLLFPSYDSKDDPEILMNNLGVEKLKLGVEINTNNPKKSLEKALSLVEFNNRFNEALKTKYRTLDGIEYIAETIFMHQTGASINERLELESISKNYK